MKDTSKQSRKSSSKRLSPVQRFGLGFYNRAKTTALLWLILVVAGILCYTTFLRREGFPSIAAPFSLVNGTYFVNDRTKVQKDVVKPISDLIMRQESVKSINAQAGDNFFAFQIEYTEGTDAASASKAIETAVTNAKLLPQQANAQFKPLSVGKLSDDGDDLLIAVYGTPTTPAAELQAKAETLAKYLRNNTSSVAGIKSIDAMELFRSGTDPATGQARTEQKSFDRIGLVRADGQRAFYPSATVGIKADENVDAIKLYDGIQNVLADARNADELRGTNYVVSADFAESVKTQIDSLQENLLGGLLAVLVVSFLLISWRGGLATALSMVTVLAITLFILRLIGYSLNTITLFSLILCLGLIVDDTTIMVEAIDASHNQDKPRREIVATAIKRVAQASLAGTLTTMLGFAPLLFVGGIIGEFIRAIPITIIISLGISLLVSWTLIPLMARGFLLGGSHKKRRNPIAAAESAISRGLAGLVLRGKGHPRRAVTTGLSAILFSVAALVAGGFIFSKVTFNIFPNTKDSDAIMVVLKFPAGTSVQSAETYADSANETLRQTLGDNLRRASYYNSGSMSGATLMVDLKSFKERDLKSPELVDQLRQAYAGAPYEATVSQLDVGPPAGGFTARIYSDNTAAANKLADDIAAFLKDKRFKRLNGTTFTVTDSRRADGGVLRSSDGRQFAAAEAAFNATDVSSLVTIVEDEVKSEFPPERVAGYGVDRDALSFDFGSEDDNQDSFKSMVVAFPILLAAMYLLLLIQFRSFLQPLLIFLAIPFSIFGIAAGLYLTDNPLSFFTMVGFFALIGISVNNTILLTDYINQGRREGLGRIDSVAAAVRARFRPLITTSITSIVALIPLALSDPFWEGLAFTLIFGLLSSTLLVIISFPYYYLAAEFLRSHISARQFFSWVILGVDISVLLSLVSKAAVLPFIVLYMLLSFVLLPILFSRFRTVRR